jgi:hypothetical protein
VREKVRAIVKPQAGLADDEELANSRNRLKRPRNGFADWMAIGRDVIDRFGLFSGTEPTFPTKHMNWVDGHVWWQKSRKCENARTAQKSESIIYTIYKCG